METLVNNNITRSSVKHLGSQSCLAKKSGQSPISWRISQRRLNQTPIQPHQLKRICSTKALASVLGELSSGGLDFDGFSSLIYSVGQQADAAVSSQLTGVTPITFLVVLSAGLATSLSPCTLSVLPLTIGYIGATSTANRGEGAATAPNPSIQALSFTAGLSSTLSLLGLLAALAGSTYGNIGGIAPLGASVVALVMGLNMLEVLPVTLPSLDVDTRSVPLPPALRAYLAGLVFALVASPCSTPVLATLLAYVSTTQDPSTGSALLLAYTAGYCAPLLLAASATGAVARLMSFRQYSAWITPTCGTLLVAGGTYGLLNRLLPA